MLSFDEKIKDLRGAMKLVVNNISWNLDAVKMVIHFAIKDSFKQKTDRDYFTNHLASDFDKIGVHYTAVRINQDNDEFLDSMRSFIR